MFLIKRLWLSCAASHAVCKLDFIYFDNMVSQIYHSDLQRNKEREKGYC